jgi:hypothetical protein
MKTIKELEEERLCYDEEKGYYRALKDVLGLIDEMTNKSNYGSPDGLLIIPEELKERITG